MECPMRVMASLLFLSLSSAALADTLPSFLNSNETTVTCPCRTCRPMPIARPPRRCKYPNPARPVPSR
jgi:hypothetical protein